MDRQGNRRNVIFGAGWIVLLICGLSLPTEVSRWFNPGQQSLLFDHGFETGNLAGFYWQENRPEVVTAPLPVREGAYSMQAYLDRYKSENPYRTQVVLAADPNMQPDRRQDPFRFTIGEEYWIGFSIFIPNSFEPDQTGMTDILFEWQATPDEGEIYRQPVLAMGIEADQWLIWSKWDARRFTPADEGSASSRGSQEWLHPISASVGYWTDWVIHVKWSYEEDGYLKIWRNGRPLVDRKGPNCSNDQEGPYLSMGVYKWSWKPKHTPPYPSNTDQRLFYIDALRIGGADASYRVVAPPRTRRVRGGLQALYTFEEDSGPIVEDVSGVGIPLDLAIQDSSATSRLPGALSIDSPVVISSERAATKIIDACLGSEEITLEAWVKPKDTRQDGPASILSLSSDIRGDNFVLAQDSSEKKQEDQYSVWLHTAGQLANDQPSVSSGPGSLTEELTHVVFTRSASGASSVYINTDFAAGGLAEGTFSGWGKTYPLVLGNVATGERPWLGELHLVAVYCRALDRSEIEQNYFAGPHNVSSRYQPARLQRR